MPRHDGIFVDSITSANPSGSGYLIMLVERSDRRPHRAELGVKQYFKRSGDSSIVMEHYDIEDSFKRLVVPWLEIEWKVWDTGVSTTGTDVKIYTPHIDILLRNPSPVTARFPFITLSDLRGIRGDPLGNLSGLVYRSYRDEHHFAGGSDLVVHPGLSLPITRLLTPQIRATRGVDGQFHVQWEQVQSVQASYRCGCYNSRHTVGQLAVTPEKFLQDAPGSLA
jgi:hypothetical protein